MGELDLLKPTLERALGGTILFGRVGMKPGKPTTVVRVPFKTDAGARVERLVFALPGNPASAMVTAGLFVLPSLQKASGERRGETTTDGDTWRAWGYPRATALLDSDATCDAVREEYQRARAWFAAGDGRLRVAVVQGGQRSSRVGNFRGANAFVVLPAGGGTLEKGETVDVMMIGIVDGSLN